MDAEDFVALADAWTEADGTRHGGLLVASAASLVDDTLQIAAELYGGTELHSAWTLTFEGVVEHRITLGAYAGYFTSSSHPLLFEHHEPRARLSFYGQVEQPTRTIGVLAEAHELLSTGWRPFDRYLRSRELPWLLTLASRVIASGPGSVLNTYARVLVETGLDASTDTKSGPVHWDDRRQWAPTEGSVALLVLTDTERDEALQAEPSSSSFVIAERVQVTPMDAAAVIGATARTPLLRPDPEAGVRSKPLRNT
jgi:hypothetical protein